MCFFQLPRPGLQLLQTSRREFAVPKLLFPILPKEKAGSQAPLRARSSPQAASCSSAVSPNHGAFARCSAELAAVPAGLEGRHQAASTGLGALRGVQKRANAETQGPQWLCAAFLGDRPMGGSGREGGTTGRAAGSGRRKENELQMQFIVPAPRLPGTCQHKHLPFVQVHSARSSKHLNISFLGSSPNLSL